MESFFILRPFNPLFFVLFGCSILILTLTSLLLRKKSEKTRTAVLVTACLVTFVSFFVYKYFLSLDTEYNQILTNQYVMELTERGMEPAEAARVAAGKSGFNWWNELPLHLCNVNMMLIPLAVLTKKRPLMGFCFFLAPLGAMLALIMPSPGFREGFSILLPRMLGYYFTHFMIVIEGLAIAAFGLYRPKFRDLPKNMLATAGLGLGAFLISTVLRLAHLSPDANYFFTYYHEGIPPLEIFFNLIHLPYLYLIPVVLGMGVYMALITSGFALAERKSHKPESEKAGEGSRV